MATENDAYGRISAQSRNHGILNKSLEVLGYEMNQKICTHLIIS